MSNQNNQIIQEGQNIPSREPQSESKLADLSKAKRIKTKMIEKIKQMMMRIKYINELSNLVSNNKIFQHGVPFLLYLV